MDKIKLGDIARDTVSGFEGVVVAITYWLHGCARVAIQPRELHEGKPIDHVSFDELQVELVNAKHHNPVTVRGGPRSEPTRNRA